jgi:hypothetical protein
MQPSRSASELRFVALSTVAFVVWRDEQSDYRDAPIVGDLDASMISLSGDLDRPVYAPRLGRASSFMVTSSERKDTLDDAELLRAAQRVRDDAGRAVVVARQYPLASATLVPLAEFEGAIDPYEKYFLCVLP